MHYNAAAMKYVFVFFVLIPGLAQAQSVRQDSIQNPVKYFIGNWQGTGEGQPGKGQYERSYQFILNKKFIEVKNKATYQPTGKNPKGEVHEDIGYISYDKYKKTFILRQFHNEGFVNQYQADSISGDGKTIVFLSEAIENIPAGWRARETYRIVSENEFTETFELAAPNGNFEVYTATTFKRINR